MSEQIKTLWLLECLQGKIGRLFTFYATDEHEAATIAYNYLVKHRELALVSLKAKPHGFTLAHAHRPGHIVCKEASV